jgi:3-deoxy-manno-octulosonate cytidylyltransferase (CMP-KDO synthetase)
LNPNVVKVALGEENRAVYFSRAPIPYPRDEFDAESVTLPEGGFYRHLGIYAYRVSTLKAITTMQEHPLESLEKLEQLRPLANGTQIVIDKASISPEHGIDTQQDLDRIRKLFN